MDKNLSLIDGTFENAWKVYISSKVKTIESFLKKEKIGW